MRYLHIVFEVMDSPAAAALTTADLYDIGEQIVADIDPDPPVLDLRRIRSRRRRLKRAVTETPPPSYRRGRFRVCTAI